MLVDDHYLVRVGLANVLGLEPDIEVSPRPRAATRPSRCTGCTVPT